MKTESNLSKKRKVKSSEKSCQRLTNGQPDFTALLRKKKLFKEDIEGWSGQNIDKLYKHIQQEFNNVSKEDFDFLMGKYYQVIPEDAKNQLWDMNHIKILEAMNRMLSKHGLFPTKTYLATETGLSRNTIQKHLDRYQDSSQHKFYRESLVLIHQNLLSTLYHQAYHGNMKAARLYMEATGLIQSSTYRQDANNSNFIQINGITINQTLLNSLSTDIQQTITKLILSTIPA